MQQVMGNKKTKPLNEEIEKELFNVSERQAVSKLEDLPDPKLHQRISFIKSAIRILGCIVGLIGFYEIGFLHLLLAEGLGVYEEMV
jgi:hypothetical protein